MNCQCGKPIHSKGLCSTCCTREWRKNNPEKYRKGIKSWYSKNKDKEVAKAKKWNKENKVKAKENLRRYVQKSDYYKNRYKNDLHFKMKVIIRNRLRTALKQNHKSGKTLDLLSCTLEQFKAHIESLWLPGMTWENHGRYGWHIDHIMPLKDFDLSDPEQLKKACHYSNMQPLWWRDNIAKNRR